MQKMNATVNTITTFVQLGKPAQPFIGKQPLIERKTADPSSSAKGEKYPIPSFYEYRVKPKEYDPL